MDAGVPRTSLPQRGFRLEYATLTWNVVGVAVLAVTASVAGSVALAGFGLDSLIEIGASTVVIWELSGADAVGKVGGPARGARAGLLRRARSNRDPAERSRARSHGPAMIRLLVA